MIATGWAKYTKYECLPNRENKLVPILAKNPYYYYCIYYNGYSPEGAINTAHQLSPAGLVYTLGASLYLFFRINAYCQLI